MAAGRVSSDLEKRGVTANGHGVSFRGDENVLELVARIIQLNILQPTELYTLKRVNFMVCKSHLQKLIKNTWEG